MAELPRPVRALPNVPAVDTEAGSRSALTTRIVIVATIVLGQLFALTVALEAKLLDRDGEAWLLAGFSILSFVVALVLTRVDPAPRARRFSGPGSPDQRTYISNPLEEHPGGGSGRT